MKDPREKLPVLGVVVHNYLRETGILRMREEARIAMFAPPDSELHRISDFSCPIRKLDISGEEIHQAVAAAIRRGIPLAGMISMRDPNVPQVAELIEKYGWKGSTPKQIKPVTSKIRFREWLNKTISKEFHTEVDFEPIAAGIGKQEFCKSIRKLFERGASAVILKPARGSCSYYIKRIGRKRDTEAEWKHFRDARSYRDGEFIAEAMINGQELSVETVVSGKNILKTFITQYLPSDRDVFYEVGHFVPDHFSEETRKRLDRLARKIHDELGLNDTITHVEMMVPKTGMPAVVEFNPRMAGDLTQELHRQVHGFDFYRVAARIAAGLQIPRHLLKTQGTSRCALIRFDRPRVGRIYTKKNLGEHLDRSTDSFGLIKSSEFVQAGGDTNDDRSAYVLLSGNKLAELDTKARWLLANAYRA
jgi:biotin carboxylase